MEKVIKFGFSSSSFLGLYYFIIYCSKENIPFPLDLTDLPALLIALGLFGFLGTILLISYTMLSSIIVLDPLNIDYKSIIHVSSFKNIKGTKALLINYFFFYVLNPSIIFFLVAFDVKEASYLIPSLFFLVPFLFSYYALSPKQKLFKGDWALKGKSLSLFFKVIVTFFYINLFSMMSGYISINYILFFLDATSNVVTFISFLAVYSISFFMFIPPLQKSNEEVLDNLGKKKIVHKELLRYPVTYIFVFLIVISLIVPSISFKTAKAAFKFLNVGGGIQREYYYAKNTKVTIPPALLEACDDNYCHTKKINVILNFGGVLYVKKIGGQTIYSLPSAQMYLIQENNQSVKAG